MGNRYEAKPVCKTARVVNGLRKVGPPTPLGIAIPVGWVLTPSGHFMLERDYLAEHRLEYILNHVSR